MKLKFIALCGFLIVLTSCDSDKKPAPFKIQKQNIGLLTDSTQVRELKSIFEGDSIFNFKEDDSFTGNINTIEIFEKEGTPLLVLTPTEALDSTATISTIRFLDPRYKTDKGISSMSTFKEINDAYEIKKITNLINSVLISVKNSNITFTIDKKELPANARFIMDMEIDPIQIPEKAKVKYFMMHW